MGPVYTAETLRVEFKRSRLLAGLLGLAHVSALAAVWVSLAGWPLYLLMAGISVSAVACIAEALHGSAGAVTSLELHADGRVIWRDRKGEAHEACLSGDHFVSVPLLVIGLNRSRSPRRWIVLLPDSASPEESRRLRVWLRWRATNESDKVEAPAEPE